MHAGINAPDCDADSAVPSVSPPELPPSVWVGAPSTAKYHEPIYLGVVLRQPGKPNKFARSLWNVLAGEPRQIRCPMLDRLL
jgi:hypothetical protein